MSLIVRSSRLFLIIGSMSVVVGCAGDTADFQAATPSAASGPAIKAASAEAGEGVYLARCAMCHGDSLAGGGHIPPLAGNRFREDWGGRTWRSLYGQTISTMPWTAPGTLSEEEVLNAVLFIAEKNGDRQNRQVTSSDDLNDFIISAGTSPAAAQR